MFARVLTMCVIISISAFIGQLNSTAFCGEDHQEIAQYYESCIVREIAKCDSKLALLATSKTKNLKDYVALKAQKGQFLKAGREVLIEEMIKMQLEPKHYKVEVFLNSRFYKRNQ